MVDLRGDGDTGLPYRFIRGKALTLLGLMNAPSDLAAAAVDVQ